MKKILVFSLSYFPHVGGAEVAVKEITDRISNVEFHMITLRFADESKCERVGNIKVHRIGFGSSYLSKILFIPLAALKARKLHKKESFDGIWAMMSYMLIPIVLMRFRGTKLPYVLTLQEGDTYQHMFGRLRILPFLPLISTGFKNASVVQAISNYLAEWAHKRGFNGVVEVIPNGFDYWWFEQDLTREGWTRQKFWKDKNIVDSGKMLVTTSRLVKKNAIDVVIRSLPLLERDVRFVILGDGKKLKYLEKLAKDLNVSDRINFCGSVSNSQVLFYLKASDIFVRPSRSEGMGNSFIEAMAAGLPIIATQEGGIADFLFDEKRDPDREPTGWAVDKDSPEQIVSAVRDISAHPEKAKRVTQNAKKLAVEKYDWDIIARDMREKVFAVLLDARA